MNFPENIGFTLNGETDEWEKPLIKGKLLIWKNLTSTKWTLAQEDEDEYIHTLRVGSEDDISHGMKAFWRDLRLEELLSNK